MEKVMLVGGERWTERGNKRMHWYRYWCGIESAVAFWRFWNLNDYLVLGYCTACFDSVRFFAHAFWYAKMNNFWKTKRINVVLIFRALIRRIDAKFRITTQRYNILYFSHDVFFWIRCNFLVTTQQATFTKLLRLLLTTTISSKGNCQLRTMEQRKTKL